MVGPDQFTCVLPELFVIFRVLPKARVNYASVSLVIISLRILIFSVTFQASLLHQEPCYFAPQLPRVCVRVCMGMFVYTCVCVCLSVCWKMGLCGVPRSLGNIHI